MINASPAATASPRASTRWPEPIQIPLQLLIGGIGIQQSAVNLQRGIQPEAFLAIQSFLPVAGRLPPQGRIDER